MSQTTKALLALRSAVGTSSWLTPRAAGRAFGLNAAANPQSPYLARLFGIRDLALAAGYAGAAPAARRHWLTVGIACDLADVAAGVIGTKAGYLSKSTGAMVTGAAVGAVVLGALALSEEPASQTS
jgi:hypothetical protein